MFRRYDELVDVGNARELIRELLAAAERDDEPERFADLVVQACDRFRGWPALRGDRTTFDAAAGLLARSGVGKLHKLTNLWETRPPIAGRALFPVVVRSTQTAAAYGSLREIRVSAQRVRSEYEPPRAGFRDAVEAARLLADRHAPGGSHGEHWSVFPDVASNEFLEGESVGLAAFVAFVSYRSGRPVDAGFAFTGVVREGELDRVKEQTLASKMKGLSERPFVSRVYVARYRLPPADVTPPEGCCWDGLRDPRAILDGALLDGPARAARRSAPPSRTPTTVEIDARIVALARAARAPLPLRVVEHCALRSGAWTDKVDPVGVIVSDRVRSLENRSQLTIESETVTHARSSEVHPLCDERHRRAAGVTLSHVLWLESDPAAKREAVHHALSVGEHDLAARYVGSLIEKEPHRGPWLLDGLIGEDVESRAEEKDWTRMLDLLESSAESMLLRVLSAVRHLPQPLREPFAPMGQQMPWVDRLLCLQAGWESILHLLASTSVAAQREGIVVPVRESVLEGLADRPSLGRLAAQIRHLVSSSPGTAMGRSLANTGVVQGALRTTELLNAWLHHFGAAFELAVGGNDLARESFARLGAVVAPVLRQLVEFFRIHRIREQAADPSSQRPAFPLPCEVRLGESGAYLSLAGLTHCVRRSTSFELVHMRGMVDGAVRYWSFASPREYRVSAPKGLSARQYVMTPSNPGVFRRHELEKLALEQAPGALRLGMLPVLLAWPLKRYYHAASARDGFGMFACVDLLVATMLRLTWFAALREAAGPLRGLGPKMPVWLGRMTKRALHSELVRLYRTGVFVHDGPSGEALRVLADGESAGWCAELISLLERLEHATGPRTSRPELAEAAFAHVQRLLPMCEHTLTLGTEMHGRTCLNGPQPPVPKALRDGEMLPVAWSCRDAFVSLWPWVVARVDHRVLQFFVLVDARGKSRRLHDLDKITPRYVGMAGSRFCVRDARWVEDDNAADGIRVVLR